jgi:hypothetical protein
VRIIKNINSEKVEIEKQGLTNGLYFYRLESAKKISSGKIAFTD